VAELRTVSGFLNRVDERFSAGATGDVGFGRGDLRQLNVRTLLQALFYAFDAVAAGEAIERQVDGL
jgi:hypothetical protein